MSVYIKLFHGRNTADEELDDLGFRWSYIRTIPVCSHDIWE